MKIQLSGFSYVDRPRKRGKALRFAFSLSIPLNTGEDAELTIEGCLAYWDYQKVLRWSPPVTRWAPTRTQNFHWINRPLYDLVLGILTSHPKSKSMLDDMFTPMQKLLEAQEKLVQNTDASYPTLLEGEIEEREDEQL